MSGILTGTNKDWAAGERKMARRVKQAAVESKSMEVSEDHIVVRQLLPSRDLEPGGENTWASDHEWRQDWAGSGVGGEFNAAYTIDSNSSAKDKVIGFYGISLNSTVPVTRALRFRSGPSGDHGTLTEVDVEPVENDRESRGVLSTGVIYGAEDNGRIEMWIDSATDGNRVVLHGWVAEQPGNVFTNAVEPDFC